MYGDKKLFSHRDYLSCTSRFETITSAAEQSREPFGIIGIRSRQEVPSDHDQYDFVLFCASEGQEYWSNALIQAL